MANYRSSRLLPTILTIVVIIVAIAGLVGLVRWLFVGSASNTPPVADTSQQSLLDTSVGRAVSMTVRGPIVADEDFRSYKIIISPSSRDFKAYTGYLETVTSSQTLSNNSAAYSQFVHALDVANLVAGDPFDSEKNDVLGICATGKVYEFSLIYNDDVVETLWTSTCSGSPGSLRANATQLSALFLNQIPNGSNIEATLKL